MDKILPKSWNEDTKPHLYCPGCGHGTILKHLGYVIDELGIKSKTTFGIDIGCSLLAWNLFNFDTIQTHHGRTASVMLGYKISKPKRIALAYMGDGAAYAIGLQSILHTAYRNHPITIIVVNNENYAMTGGQMSPETEQGVVTATSPNGKPAELGTGLFGPELIANVASEDAFIARGTMSNPIQLESLIKQAILNQTENNAFSFLEILSICPTNWKTNAKDSFGILKNMESYYKVGIIRGEKKKESK